MASKVTSLEDGFNRSKTKIVDTNTCINWLGNISTTGYGLVYFRYKLYRAHRVSYEIFKGKIPKDLIIMHTCDNRKCVNPKHLIAATQSVNLKDMYNKGRGYRDLPKGESNHNAKLANTQIKDIRNSSLSSRKLGKLFNVSKTAILFIKQGKTYKDIT